MKAAIIAILLVFAVVSAGDITFAAQSEATIEKGTVLFNDPKLGTNGKSCNFCHPNGKGLEKSGSSPDLVDTINGCITIPLKGKALDPKSVEMQSLVLYIKSLGSR
jgi:cytochrome c peroxidase